MTLSKRITAWLLACLLLLTAVGCDADLSAANDADTTTTVYHTATTTTTADSGDITSSTTSSQTQTTSPQGGNDTDISTDTIPAFTGSPFIVLNNNEPLFTDAEKQTVVSFESYAPLDSLGRCGVAMACVGQDIMPTEDRGAIGSVKPSGWQSVKYDIVDGKYLYNRCHLLGFQLTGENANPQNLITGTRYMNVDGMLPFENMVADYVKETGNHVLLRVTPVFEGNNLVASGVVMEAYSVEDDGDGICFHVYCYNAQPGIVINYADGTSYQTNTITTTTITTTTTTAPQQTVYSYVLNTSTKKIHKTTCRHVQSIKAENYAESSLSVTELEAQGYTTCGTCF